MSKKYQAPRFEPDIRFLLANERTLLAWIRTSVGLQAGGLVVAYIGEPTPSAQKWLAILIITIGAIMAAIGYFRYRSAGEAIRNGELPPQGKAPLLQSAGMVIVSAMLIALILIGT